MAFDLGSALFGVFVGVAGFVGKRLWPSERRREKRDEYSALAGIAAMMKEKNLTHDDVQGVAALVRGEERRAEEVALSGTINAGAQLQGDMQVSNYWTQASMNERSASEYHQADSRMQAAFVRLRQLLDDREVDLFEQTQEAWLTFRDRQAEFTGAEYEGGSIVPLVESSEKQVLTETRAIALEAAFNDRAKRTGVNTGDSGEA